MVNLIWTENPFVFESCLFIEITKFKKNYTIFCHQIWCSCSLDLRIRLISPENNSIFTHFKYLRVEHTIFHNDSSIFDSFCFTRIFFFGMNWEQVMCRWQKFDSLNWSTKFLSWIVPFGISDVCMRR